MVSPKQKRGKGRPFKKGETGNPGGRPKVSPEQRAARLDAQAILDAHTPDAAWTLVDMLKSAEPKDRREAANSILDRASLTGTSRLQLTGADGGPIQHDLKRFTDRQLRVLNALVAIAERRDLTSAEQKELDALMGERKALTA